MPDSQRPPAPRERVLALPPARGGAALHYRIDGGYLVIETRLSPRGSVASWTVRPDGRRVTVATRRGGDTPDAIVSVAAQAWRPDLRSGGRR